MDGLNPGSKRIPRLFFTPQEVRTLSCSCLSRAVTNKAKCAIACVISLPQICWAGWVGDQDSTYYGLQAALLNMFASAYHNYVNVGSDLGGFRYVNYQIVAVCNLS